jgi:predicted GTPase
MLPHEKELVKLLANEPFALIGINSDGDAKKVNEILTKEKITWRQVIDGSTSGPIATQWNVHGWPTIFILDSKGVIRHRDLRDKQMEEAVLKLLDEMKKQ